MTMKKKSLFDKILDIVILLVFLLTAYWILQLIFGGSPLLSQVNLGLILGLGGAVYKLNREIGEIKMEIKYGFKNMDDRIRSGFDKMKEEINGIKK